MRSLLASGSLCLLLLACSAGTEVEAPDAEGAYAATTLTAVDATETIDVLADGGSLILTLHGNGTTTGRLFAPGAGEDGENLDEDLAGTWSQTGEQVTFSQAADTFIRDATWTVDAVSLSTTYNSGNATVNAVLARQ